MEITSLTSSSAKILFTALAKGNKLMGLHINSNLITDEACDAIAATMKNNKSLVKLWMYDDIGPETAQHLCSSNLVVQQHITKTMAASCLHWRCREEV